MLQSSFSVNSGPKAPKLDPFVLHLFQMPPVTPKVYASEISWDEMQEMARVARERKRYEATINEVTSELEAMRAKVAELLEENNKLPESERMDVHDFELDVEEQQRRVNEGMDKEDDLRFELKAWQIARHRVGQKVRKKVWDDMEVKGRTINGIQVRVWMSGAQKSSERRSKEHRAPFIFHAR